MKASSTIALGTGQAKTSRLDRTPCHTCRLKRLRCDGGEPRCNKCAVRGVECLGYGERPIRWVLQQSLGLPPPEGATTSEQHHGRAVRRPMIEGAQRKRGRPKLVLMSHDDQRDRTELQLCVVQKQGRIPFPGANLDPVEYQHHRRILSSLEYFNTEMCPDLVLVDTATNPHRISLRDWQSTPELLVSLVVSSSVIHRVIKCHVQQLQYECSNNKSAPDSGVFGIYKQFMASLPSSLMPVAYEHHRRALSDLQKQLDDPSTRYSDLALTGIVLLSRVEFQQSALGAWRPHLAAAQTIITHRGGFSQLVTKPNYRTLSMFMTTNVSQTMLVPAQLLGADVLSQVDFLPHLDMLLCNGLESEVPCPSLLFAAVICVNVARMRSCDPTIGDEEIDAEASQVLMGIVSFDPKAWTRTHLQKLFSPAVSGRMTARKAAHDMCEDMASSFKYVVMVFCLRTLFVDRRWPRGPGPVAPQALVPVRDDLYMDAESARKWALSRVMETTRRVWARERSEVLGVTWCGKFCAMQLFVGGLETCPSGPAAAGDRIFIATCLGRLAFHNGDLGYFDSLSMLEVIWRDTAHAPGSNLAGQQMSWDDRLMLPGVNLLF
ncbi:hypothetical protein G6O67_003603 [Ophiocordyceps sinensis]|uniref:Zn(2)-C6 fungal-type domain-containing protein n=2 Tax=Ophiocordyceps sinensis TaxID=72228 RepID=A0A8H4PS34_9HYPO|nr:Zn(2)-C6 fungal-type DNA-binding domain protein [Ophiocordyceps sinensis CO18]KAF4509427.1 hypothetical protein G6O67_003603 [Ophiocordyceps sinensis]